MIVDVHGHLSAPNELNRYKQRVIDGENGPLVVSDEQIQEGLDRQWPDGRGHLQRLKDFGTDLQRMCPRPFHLPHHEKSDRLVRLCVEAANDLIAHNCRVFPDLFRGIAGLPQQAGASPKNCVPELERCVTELGFIGCTINPDPEGSVGERTPGMRDEYWYPLYEKMVELDVPAVIHSAGSCSDRASSSVHHITEQTIAATSLLEGLGGRTDAGSPPNRVWQNFPNLKIVICHGGGALPFQIGRFKSASYRGPGEPFEQSVRRLYYDTCMYSRNALDLLFKEVGPDRCLFGAENPGMGSSLDPATGQQMDDLAPGVESIEWLIETDRKLIFEGNARHLFRL